MMTQRPRTTRWFDTLAAAVAIGFLAVMVVWPLIAIGRRSLQGSEAADLVDVLGRPATWRVLRFTVWQALLSTVATVVVGLPIAHVLARYRFRGRNMVRVITVVPFVLPTVVVAAALSALFDTIGVDLDRSLTAIVAAHVFFNLAVVVRVVGGFWSTLDRSSEEAAAVLGASPRQAFLSITLPRIAPVLAGASLVVFLFCFTSYGIILILGGPATATIETEIRRYAIFRQEFDVAAVLAFLQLIVVIALSIGSARLQRRLSVSSTARRAPAPLRLDSVRRRVYVGLVLCLVAAVVFGPMLALVEQSFSVGTHYGLDNYRALSEPIPLLPVSPARALWQSVRLALGAALVAGIVGVPAARVIANGGRTGKMLEAAVLIPLGVSAATLGFGYLLAFTIFDLRRSPLLLPLAHAVVALPFVMAAVVPALRAIDPRLRQAAATLGASPGEVLRRIDWPLARAGLVTGLGFSIAVSLGEFGATSFISRGAGSFTAPLAVFRLLSQPGQELRGQAMAISVIIGLVVGATAALLERGREGGKGFL